MYATLVDDTSKWQCTSMASAHSQSFLQCLSQTAILCLVIRPHVTIANKPLQV